MLSLRRLTRVFLFSAIFGQLFCMLWILLEIFAYGRVTLIEPDLFILVPEIVISFISVIFSIVLMHEYAEKIRTKKVVPHR
jgi:hypothetical protein